MLIESFLNYITHERRYSAHTVLAYKTDLLQFAEFLEREYAILPDEARSLHVRAYTAALMNDKVMASSVGRKLSAIRSCYKYLIRQKKIAVSPIPHIRPPKVPKKLPVTVGDEQLDHLLDSGDFFTDSFGSVRDKTIIELLFGTGMRLAELLKLNETAFNFYESTVRVTGKGNKERIIPITKVLISQVQSYITLKSLQNFNNKSDGLFVTDKGAPIYPMFVYKLVKHYLGYITTQDKKSPHVLRHSYATSMLNRGADLNAIKELLGHASLAATQVYTHNSIERLKTIHKQAHPKA